MPEPAPSFKVGVQRLSDALRALEPAAQDAAAASAALRSGADLAAVATTLDALLERIVAAAEAAASYRMLVARAEAGWQLKRRQN